MRGRRVLHCLGDSHAEIFIAIAADGLLRDTDLDVTVVSGATALGLSNPNSRTQALVIFERKLRRLPRHGTVLLSLGEVDCGFLLWYQDERGIASTDEGFERSLANYTAFLAESLRRGFSLIVMSVPQPSIEDYATWAETTNVRREVHADLDARVAVTRRYNERLRVWCRENGVPMLDFEDDVLDEDSRLRPEYRSSDLEDHHYDQTTFSHLVAAKLVELGYR
ncbi:MAG: hypothetical protein JWN67_3681 [Actinomycetia bacterium]|nr:hypothetical protein [Actinomycetes bacterium]